MTLNWFVEDWALAVLEKINSQWIPHLQRLTSVKMFSYEYSIFIWPWSPSLTEGSLIQMFRIWRSFALRIPSLWSSILMKTHQWAATKLNKIKFLSALLLLFRSNLQSTKVASIFVEIFQFKIIIFCAWACMAKSTIAFGPSCPLPDWWWVANSGWYHQICQFFVSWYWLQKETSITGETCDNVLVTRHADISFQCSAGIL